MSVSEAVKAMETFRMEEQIDSIQLLQDYVVEVFFDYAENRDLEALRIGLETAAKSRVLKGQKEAPLMAGQNGRYLER